MNSHLVKFILIGIFAMLIGSCAQRAVLQPTARGQYDFAMDLLKRGKCDAAVVEFQKVLYNYPGLSYIDSAQYWFAMSYYGRDDYHLAVAEFRRVISNFPSSNLIDDAQFMIGKSYFEAAPHNVGLDQSDTENAIKELTDFINDYPSSDRLNEGELLLSEAIDRMATKQFKAGKQYFKMGNFDAARIYFEDLIKEYPESKLIPEALYLLAQVDEEDHKYVDARDKLNNLIKTFPKSEFASKAAKYKEKLETRMNASADTNHTAIKVTEQKSE